MAADPSELDVMVAILEMPPTSRDIGEGYGTFYFWPYLVNSDLDLADAARSSPTSPHSGTRTRRSS